MSKLKKNDLLNWSFDYLYPEELACLIKVGSKFKKLITQRSEFKVES